MHLGETQGVEGQGEMQPRSRLSQPELVELRDGAKAIIRPIRADDAPGLQSLFGRLSRESIYYRFLELRKELTREQAQRLANLDHHDQMALVATRDQCETEILGVARYAVVPGSQPVDAEAAIVVEDRYQNRGLGALLLERLAAYAVAQGIEAFVATVRNDNGRILSLVRRSGLQTEFEVESGTMALRVRLRRDASGARQRGQEEPCLSETE